jgi:hypothetical protein
MTVGRNPTPPGEGAGAQTPCDGIVERRPPQQPPSGTIQGMTATAGHGVRTRPGSVEPAEPNRPT